MNVNRLDQPDDLGQPDRRRDRRPVHITHSGVDDCSTSTLTNGDTVDALVTKINNAIKAADTLIPRHRPASLPPMRRSDQADQRQGRQITVGNGTTNGAAAGRGRLGAQVVTAKTTDQLVSEINANTSLAAR